MRLLSTSDFAKECGCSYEAIRLKINVEITPETMNPVVIDADKYDYIIKTFQNKKRGTENLIER